MAQHGYLREYDEGWDRGDDDRDRARADRDSHDRSRDRDFMFRGHDRDRDSDRGFFDRMGDRARQAFGEDDRQFRGSHEHDRSNRERGFGSSPYGRQQRSGGTDWDRSPRNFSSHQDDHYLSWRNRQLEALDRDYDDYCREREQQFHSDFDSWRRNRRPAGSGSQQSQSSNKDEIELTAEDELTRSRAMAGQGNTPSPEGAATLGTNNSENSGIGRGKGQA